MSVFTLLLCLAVQEVVGLRDPAVSPDGKRVAFSWRGDLWLVDAAGGRAERVTDDPAHEDAPAWSPDGGRLAFVSDRAGNLDIFVLDLGRGGIRQITFHEADDDRPAWSPDGGWIAFESNRDPRVNLPTNRRWFDIWKVRAGGGTPQSVTRFGGRDPAWSPDGRRIVYDRYASGYADGEHDLYAVAADGGNPERLTSGPEDDREATFQGDRLVFARKSGRSWGVFVLEGGKEPRRLLDSRIECRSPSSGGDTLVLLAGTGLADSNGREIRITARADEPAELEEEIRGGFLSPTWLPGGTHWVGVLRGDVWRMRVDGKAAERLTRTLEEEREVACGPGGRIFFVRGPFGGPGKVFELGGDPAGTAGESAFIRAPVVSADGALLAYHVSTPKGTDLIVLSKKTGKVLLRRDSPNLEESYPAFSPDGKHLLYLRRDPAAGRTEFVLEPLEGRGEKLVHEEAGECRYLQWSPDGSRLAYCRINAKGYFGLRLLTLNPKVLKIVERPRGISIHRPAWSPDGTRIVMELRPVVRGIEDSRTAGLGVCDLEGRLEHVPFVIARRVPVEERMRQVFRQVWDLFRWRFFDPEMNGADWEGLRERLEPLARTCRTSRELHRLLADLISRLGVSHARHMPAGRSRVKTGMLGAELVQEEGGLRVREVLPGGPADWYDIRPGDLLVSADGRRLSEINLNRILTVGADERLPEPEFEVRSGERVRRVRIRTVDREAIRKERYAQVLARRKELVRRLSGGRVGYHHIPFMTAARVETLERALREELAGCEGLVLDLRDGVGGLAHWQVLALLDGRIRGWFRSRGVLEKKNRGGAWEADVCEPNSIGGPVPSGKGWRKPVVLVQNRVTRSDKEILSYTFAKAGLGFRVGETTAGAVLGSIPVRLLDGSSIFLPVQAWRTTEGVLLEGHGIKPDFEVRFTLEDLRRGRDPQLERAVRILIEQLEGTRPARGAGPPWRD